MPSSPSFAGAFGSASEKVSSLLMFVLMPFVQLQICETMVNTSPLSPILNLSATWPAAWIVPFAAIVPPASEMSTTATSLWFQLLLVAMKKKRSVAVTALPQPPIKSELRAAGAARLLKSNDDRIVPHALFV